MRLDPYKHKEKYEGWKEESKHGISEISKINSSIILNYVLDMETGQNVARGTKKGARSYTRLNTIRTRMIFLSKLLEQRGFKDLSKINEKEIHFFFDDMNKGRIKRVDGREYQSVVDYIKVFKSFWHWLIKIKRKEGSELSDITLDLDTSRDENSFTYFTFDELKKLLPYFNSDEQVRMLFMFDTIIRSPTELMNVKISDLSSDFTELTIREETSKTYGRTIKLLLCREELKKYVERNKIKENEFLFKFSPPMFNQKLKKMANAVFGDKMSKGGKSYSELTMYDFRHSGACHWRKGAYQTKIDALMYRGGWSNLTMLNYYTKKIGMKYNIEKEDLLIGVDKTQLEKELDENRGEIEKLRKDKEHSQENMQIMAQELKEIRRQIARLSEIKTGGR